MKVLGYIVAGVAGLLAGAGAIAGLTGPRTVRVINTSVDELDDEPVVERFSAVQAAEKEAKKAAKKAAEAKAAKRAAKAAAKAAMEEAKV